MYFLIKKEFGGLLLVYSSAGFVMVSSGFPFFSSSRRRSFLGMNSLGSPDYHNAGLQLIAENRRYNDLDCVHTHPETGAKVYIGNLVAAQSLEILGRHRITRVVNCQDTNTDNYFENHPDFEYLRFPVSHWWRQPGMGRPETVMRYWNTCFNWIDLQLHLGKSILVHCLAGAHRAGTTGVGYCMYINRQGYKLTLKQVKTIRSIVDPFGPLEELLLKLEASMKILNMNPSTGGAQTSPGSPSATAGERQKPQNPKSPADQATGSKSMKDRVYAFSRGND